MYAISVNCCWVSSCDTKERNRKEKYVQCEYFSSWWSTRHFDYEIVAEFGLGFPGWIKCNYLVYLLACSLACFTGTLNKISQSSILKCISLFFFYPTPTYILSTAQLSVSNLSNMFAWTTIFVPLYGEVGGSEIECKYCSKSSAFYKYLYKGDKSIAS